MKEKKHPCCTICVLSKAYKNIKSLVIFERESNDTSGGAVSRKVFYYQQLFSIAHYY